MRTAPDIDVVRTLPIRHDAEVTQDFIDVNGHMNITQYLRLGAEAVDLALRAAGMDDDYRERRHLSCFAVEHHLTYRAEMHLGQEITAHPQLLARSDRAAHAMVYLVDATNDRLANTLEVVLVHVDMRTRRSVPFPDEVAESLDAMVLRDVAVLDPPLCGVMGVRG
ncbi:thioesterase family protein [Blastococcus mobilis]|uniref:Acyl-CoA thioester hydrolase n=1 Tax=Blastococcus mobilis TaxID=1938746 RepID=A0A238ZCF2_9ACTN|nr:thioesterase family protein [Blastococcus mobilis]SNR80970.1 acyl-CoA thioester hydrolase [Blastococcus mobilis]